MQGIALCQLIPGATFVQMSAYIGYRLRGIGGALACMAGFVLPAFVLMLILSAIYFRFGDLWIVQSLFKGLAPIIVAIVLDAFINFGKPMVKDWKTIIIVGLAFAGFVFHMNIVLVFLIAGALALLLRLAVSEKALPSPAPSGAAKTKRSLSVRIGRHYHHLVCCLLFPERAALLSRSHYGKSGRAGLWRGVHDHWPHSARCCRAVSVGKHKGVPRRDCHGAGYSGTDRDHGHVPGVQACRFPGRRDGYGRHFHFGFFHSEFADALL